ncbi:LuxR C-terminal-related transcriptional regulator [Streptomyces sp. MST-110588]|uniref:helix-turn-helix transcriptional regulator n=1 Tax=Streptomyces sp. MST-110588 TaxID=2833628 RepID=UPI001F5D9251|nr:LuxR C-terminal-related transcriptional regulator [Streptomyces sp. MST-110588]UNO43404.1 response regulator transcription factor [Streptomyces sp. MST-110588]
MLAARPTPRRSRAPAGPWETGRAPDLYGRLRERGREAVAADPAVSACLVWIADILVEIAEELGDPRLADTLVDRMSVVRAAVPRQRRGAPGPRASAEPLTNRELTVLRHLQEGVPLRRIADDLFVSYNTVKSHTRAVYRKLGAHSRAEALHRARQHGLIR